jgi:transcription antitermination factor NusG
MGASDRGYAQRHGANQDPAEAGLESVMVDSAVSGSDVWFVAHTRPRCEKKVVQYCADLEFQTTLPCYKSVRKYRGKTVSFEKPLFPGYVFLKMPREMRGKIFQSDYVANLLEVYDQPLFEQQLSDILRALDTGLEIVLAPDIGKGTRVNIKTGALAGMEGWVEERYGFETVLLRLNFIGQAAAVKINAAELEPI